VKRALIVAVALLAAACAPTLRRLDGGITAYQRGEYPLAMQRFVEAEGDQSSLGPELGTRYLVYRGLAAWHLGMKAEAKALLLKGKRAMDAGDGKGIPAAVVEEMNRAIAELGP
jgi:hypothetical protein